MTISWRIFFYEGLNFFLFFFNLFLLGIFLIYIFNAIPKVPHTHPTPNSLPTHSPFLALVFPWLGHIKFASPMGLSFQWWPTRPSFDTYAARDKSSGVLLSSYCCSTYRVAVPFSSLGTFSSSSIGGPVIHSKADCEHPLLCLLGPGIVSQETAISGSFQQNLASVCNGVSVWKLIMGWIPGYSNALHYNVRNEKFVIKNTKFWVLLFSKCYFSPPVKCFLFVYLLSWRHYLAM
jgi:hypothetical protein